MDIDRQIARIQEKLPAADLADPKRLVFGADKHKYALNPPLSPEALRAIEDEHTISLPIDYAAFLTRVGNGGAGPFYGVYALQKAIEYSEDSVIQRRCLIAPDMTKKQWSEFILPHQQLDEDASDEAEAEEWCRLFGGTLPLGTQGCSYLHYLILNGPHAGQVVNLNEDLRPPTFAYERTFLDWYERWLDEVIAGYLQHASSYWFGYLRGGDDLQLMAEMDAASSVEKLSFLEGLDKLVSVHASTVERLVEMSSDADPEMHELATLLLTKFAPDRAAPHLHQLINGTERQLLAACKAIHWHARDRAAGFSEALLRRGHGVQDPEVFRFMGYVLQDAEADWLSELTHYCRHESLDIRRTAFYFLGHNPVSNRQQYLETFLDGLTNEDPRTVHAALQGSQGLVDPQLYAAFLNIAERFQTEEHYILTNLNHRLSEHGFSSIEDFRSKLDGNDGNPLRSLFGWLKHGRN